ncbi:MAG: squalene/phytoene synthase family protein [Planctomycetota bacterium]
MDLTQAHQFATRQARAACGELYPGPVLVPRDLLRAMDPILAVALGPAREGSERFQASLERMLRGRPDGPLLLSLWASVAAGEIPHRDLRVMAARMPSPLPGAPATREELLAWMRPRVACIARPVLDVAGRRNEQTEAAAVHLGCGLALTRLLLQLPHDLTQGRLPLPREDLEAAGCSREELFAGVRTPAVDRFLQREAQWAWEELDRGLPLAGRLVGARLRRGFRAAVLRARGLLQRITDPERDFFRRPPRLRPARRWSYAVRVWWRVRPSRRTA